MSLQTRSLDQITEADLRALQDNGVRESRTLDYKQSLPGDTDSDKKELLADITAFANTRGGDLLFGIREQRDSEGRSLGVPEAIEGMDIPNLDQLTLRWISLFRDAIKPRIQGLQLRAIPLATGQHVILIRVPASLYTPHMVAYKGASAFYIRSEAGKSPMDIDEIRSAVLRGATLLDAAEAFRQARAATILEGRSPLPLAVTNAQLLLHLIPLGAPPFAVDFSDGSVNAIVRDLRTITSFQSFDTRLNVEGRVNFLPPDQATGHVDSYVHIFRNGSIEFGDHAQLRPFPTNSGEQRVWESPTTERAIVSAVQGAQQLLTQLNISFPTLMMLSLLNVQGYTLAEPRGLNSRGMRNTGIDRPHVYIPGQVIDRDDQSIEAILKPIFDTVANAAGYVRSFAYDEAGQWRSES